jgi:hypothetical protein
MEVHAARLAKQTPLPHTSIYCATGEEFPAFEPCKEMKGQRDI